MVLEVLLRDEVEPAESDSDALVPDECAVPCVDVGGGGATVGRGAAVREALAVAGLADSFSPAGAFSDFSAAVAGTSAFAGSSVFAVSVLEGWLPLLTKV